MSLQFTKKQIIILTSIILLILVGFVLFYFVKVKPIKTSNQQLENELTVEQKLFDVVVGKRNNIDKPVISSTELQKKIPVIPLVEQLILDLERAETISGTKIINIAFGDATSNFSIEENGNNEDATTGVMNGNASVEGVDDNTNQNNSNSSNKNNIPIIIEPELANGLKQIIITLTVESRSYFELEKFINNIEHQTRVAKINSLTFAGRPEIFTLNQEQSPLNFNVTLSTFYMPDMKELEGDTPRIELPEPSNKKNPLSVGLDEVKENDE